MLNPFLKLFFQPKFRKNFEKRGIANFYNFDAAYFSRLLNSKDPEFWKKQGEKMALSLFREASENVPAYKDFLKQNGVNPETVKTIKDFKKLPITDKNNYLKKYSLEKLCWDGKLANNTLFSASSGSSGTPFFWPRGNNLELETSIVLEMMSREIFEIDKQSTLFIDGFSMGIYIAGVIILDSALRTAEKGYPMTVITPGINQEDIVRVVKEVAQKFDQVIISGYPPFIKDIIDQGELDGVNWKKLRIKFLFAAEGFSEKWRDYVFKKVGAKDILKSSVNIYGSADASILGHETPLAIAIRRAITQDPRLQEKFFGRKDLMPTFVQYNPALKFFEAVNEEVIFSCYGGIPLIRYNIHDWGGIRSYNDALALFGDKKDQVLRESEKNTIWKLPFIHVFSKSDLTVSLYGLNIYPENIKKALENKSLESFVSGKFVMQTRNKPNQDQYLEINIELKDDVAPGKILENRIKKIIIKTLQDDNMEYHALRQSIRERSDPEIKLLVRGDPEYFDPTVIKQRWKSKSQ